MKRQSRTDTRRKGWVRVLLSLVTALALIGEAGAERSETVTYYHTDGLGSVIAASDESGNLLWRERYRPFGRGFHQVIDDQRKVGVDFARQVERLVPHHVARGAGAVPCQAHGVFLLAEVGRLRRQHIAGRRYGAGAPWRFSAVFDKVSLPSAQRRAAVDKTA